MRGFVLCKAGGGSFARILPLPAFGLAPESSPLHGLLNNTVEGGKASYYKDISQEVTLPHSMGKGQGWGFPRRPNTGSGAFFSMR